MQCNDRKTTSFESFLTIAIYLKFYDQALGMYLQLSLYRHNLCCFKPSISQKFSGRRDAGSPLTGSDVEKPDNDHVLITALGSTLARNYYARIFVCLTTSTVWIVGFKAANRLDRKLASVPIFDHHYGASCHTGVDGDTRILLVSGDSCSFRVHVNVSQCSSPG